MTPMRLIAVSTELPAESIMALVKLSMGAAESGVCTQKIWRHPAVMNPMSARAKKIRFME